MFKKLIFISILSILSTVVFGQGKITLKEEKTSDLLPMSLYKTKAVGYLFKVDEGEYEGVGFKAEKLEETLSNNPEAYKEFKKFQRKTSIGKVFYWVGSAAPLVYIFSIDAKNNTDEQLIAKGITALVVTVASYTTTLVLFKNAPKHLYNAVEIYNRNLSAG